MTIAIGYASADFAFLVSDTLLTPAFELKGHVGPVSGKFHALKVQILDGQTAVAFAGDAETSLDLIRGLHSELMVTPGGDPVDWLTTEYALVSEGATGTSSDCEFLVLRHTPSGNSLAHITRGKTQYVERGYIGDPAAYRKLTGLRRRIEHPMTQSVEQPDGSFREEPLVQSAGEIEFAEISDAMRRLASSTEIATVGAISGSFIRVSVARTSGELEYLQSAFLSFSPWEGRAGYTVLASNSGIRGTGIYFRAGKVGFLLAVGDAEPCRKVNAETLQQFIDEARKEHGLELIGPTWAD